MYRYTCTDVHLCKYIMYVHKYVCSMYVCTYIQCTHIHMYISTYLSMHIHIYMYIYTFVNM